MIFRKIINFLVEGKIEKAFRQLKNYILKSNKECEKFILISYRFERMKTHVNAGLITIETYICEELRIVESLLFEMQSNENSS